MLVTYSRIPKHQAALLANKTSPIPGDDGHYVVMLNVFHELHCLVSLEIEVAWYRKSETLTGIRT